MTHAFRLGQWLVEPDLNRLTSDLGEVVIEPKSMALLTYLAERQGEVVSADDFIDVVWHGRALGDNPIYKTIGKLRRALNDDLEKPRYIETISRKGYRLVCPVEPAVAELPEAPPQASSPPAENERAHSGRRSLFGMFFAAAAVVGLAIVLIYREYETQTTPVSVAVLPFVNFGGNEQDSYFADGIAEEILNSLAQSSDLRVVSRTSSFQFRNQTKPAAEIGTALGASHLIEGSLRRSGENIRITAQLIEARTGYHLWSDTFDNQSTDIFAIQESIASSVATALNARLQPGRNKAHPTKDEQAWELYLQGQGLWQRKGEGPIRAAIAYFEKAVARDPEFALAWAALSEAWIVLPRYSQSDLDASIDKGKKAADRALSLQPDLPQPYLSRAAFENKRGNFYEGMAYAERAFALAPKHTGVLNTLSFDYGRAGWIAEATAHARLGVELDPLEGGEYVTLGYLQMVSGRLDDAESTFMRAWNNLGLRAYFVWEGVFEIHILKGDLQAAEDWLSRRPSIDGTQRRRVLISGLRNARSGDRERAIREMIDASNRGEAPLSETFDYLLALDAEDEAFELVKNGIRNGRHFMIHHLYKPFAGQLRREPRILGLADELGIADLWRTTKRMPDFCDDVKQFYECDAMLTEIAEKKPR